MRQHEPVVQRRAEADRRAAEGLLPEPGDQRPQDQLLRQAHARVRRHLEGAELDQAQPTGRAVGREQLVDADLGPMRVAGDVDQQVAEDPVDQPGRAGLAAGLGNLAECDLQLVELVLARLVQPRRLAGRADEQAREQVAEAGVVLPVGDQGGQQVGPAQERAVRGRLAADDDMVAAAGADLPPVDQELAGVEARQPRLLVERFGDRHLLLPAAGGMDVDLDHAGVGRHLDHVQSRVVGGRVALDQHRQVDLRRRVLDRGHEIGELLGTLGRRHEDAELAVARLDRQRGPHRAELLACRSRRRRRSRPAPSPAAPARAPAGPRAPRRDPSAPRRRARRARTQGREPKRQAKAHRRIAGHQVQLAAPGLPALAAPVRPALRLPALDRQDVARGDLEAALEHLGQRERAPWGRRACCRRCPGSAAARPSSRGSRRGPRRPAAPARGRGPAARSAPA